MTDEARESGESSSDDERLIADYLRGEQQAFEEFDRWIRQVLARRYPGLAREHEDLIQAAHAKLLGSLKEGRYVGGGGVRPYVSGIVHHVAVDRLREIYRVRTLAQALAVEPISPGADPYRDFEDRDADRLFHQAVHAVPAGCRELWRLLLVERLDYEEIGRRLSIPVGTVKSRMWYCRRKALAALRRLRLVQLSAPRLRRGSSRAPGRPRARS